jgi:transposase
LGQEWGLGARVRDLGGKITALNGAYRQLDHPRPPARRRRKKGGEDHAIGRSRGGLSTKINVAVDENRLPLRLITNRRPSPRFARCAASLAGLQCRHVVADRGYDADALLALIRDSGAKPHIPSTSQRLVHRSVNRRIYRQRNLVERFFNKLKHFRRIATGFDKLARNFLAAVALASARIWVRNYESTT